jgi:hypothetical protein
LAFHPVREAENSPPSSAEVKEWGELYLHSPIQLPGVVLRGSTRTNLPLPFTLIQVVLFLVFPYWRNIMLATVFARVDILSTRSRQFLWYCVFHCVRNF